MAGKILLVLLGIILLVLTVLLLIPINIRVSYECKELRAWISYASWKMMLFPRPEKNEQTQEQAAADSKKKISAEAKSEKKKKLNWAQISYSLEELPRILLRALRCTGRRITILPLKCHILIATSDPADTAVLYGRLEGVLAATLPSLHRKIRIREQDIRLFPDFCGDQMDVIADIGIRIRLGDILLVAISAAGALVKWYFGLKKRADRSDAAHKIKKKTTAANDAA